MRQTSVWLNFALYAVLGRLREADWLMRNATAPILNVARMLRTRYPFKSAPLYRGILLDGVFDPSGREFVSWSESRIVAEWFADPRSMMNEYVRSARPNSAGCLLIDEAPDPERVVFHHSWAQLEDFPKLARMHPHMGIEGAKQIEWSLASQQEVITLPLDVWPELQPFTPDGPTHDERLAPPWLA